MTNNRKQELKNMISTRQAEIETAQRELYQIDERERRESLESRKSETYIGFRVLESKENGYNMIRRRDTGVEYDYVSLDVGELPKGFEIRIEFPLIDEFNIYVTQSSKTILTSEGLHNDHHLKIVKKKEG